MPMEMLHDMGADLFLGGFVASVVGVACGGYELEGRHGCGCAVSGHVM